MDLKTINNSLNWFEIPTIDFERARKFYSFLYDFDMPIVEMGEDLLAFFPVQPGHIGGALIKTEGHTPSENGALLYLNGGEDLNAICSRIAPAGGKVVTEKTSISPEHGFYALFIDTEGNRVALHSMK